MKKVVVYVTAFLIIFLIWPSAYQYVPSCTYSEQMCAEINIKPSSRLEWFSGYRFIKDSFDSRMKVNHSSKLEYDAIGRGGADQFNFNAFAVLLLICTPVYIYVLNRKLIKGRIKAILQ
jgi:hypothetical protein